MCFLSKYVYVFAVSEIEIWAMQHVTMLHYGTGTANFHWTLQA